MPKLIAIVEDEKDIAELVALHLSNAGFTVRQYHDGHSFLAALVQRVPDLVVLDLMLPDADGLDICGSLRKDPRLAGTAIIILTAKAGETDRVVGLELGADDYIVKPFSPRELTARVKAVLRRREQPAELTVLRIGAGLVLDPGKHEVMLHGKRLDLTLTEFKILHLLASRPGWVFGRDKILDHLWGNEKAVIDRTVDVHIRHLREKLGRAGEMVRNVRGVGYKLEL